MLCNKCYLEKGPEAFSLKNKGKDIRHTICKDCHSAYRKQHYSNNKKKYIAKAFTWNQKQREVLSKYLFNKLSQSKCKDCGEKDILVLDFDHLRDKKWGIAQMYRNRHSVQTCEKEIEKCEVRCANCHRRKTAKEAGSWKYKMLMEQT
ncbi:MAG TPA: hypothetical protein VD999_01660 [Vitreimonas sp.]|nr:hypothetical protein [Vitreimonas sp.]